MTEVDRMNRNSRVQAPPHSAISAVGRAMAIIELLSDSPQGHTVTDLSAEMGINKGLTHRILASLAGSDYIYKEPLTQHYRLSTKLLNLAYRHVRSMQMYDMVLPILRRLSDASQELAELNWVQNSRLVLVAKTESPRKVKVVDFIGEELVLHATAGGKVWLANLPEDEALRVLVERGTPKLGEFTKTDLNEIREELQSIRQQGFAINDQETADDVVAIAAPVWLDGPTPHVVGAVSVVSPAYRQIHRNPEIIRMTIEVANEIGEIGRFLGLER